MRRDRWRDGVIDSIDRRESRYPIPLPLSPVLRPRFPGSPGSLASLPSPAAQPRSADYPTLRRLARWRALRDSADPRLWRGFPLPLITISIVRTISFSIYSATKRILNSEPGTVEQTTDASGKTPWINLRLGILNRDSTLDVALTSLLAGAASGAVVCVGSAPFELVKVGLTRERSAESEGEQEG